jgi:hypothetical protein
MNKKTVFGVALIVILIFPTCFKQQSDRYPNQRDSVEEDFEDLYDDGQYNAEEDFEIVTRTTRDGNIVIIEKYIGKKKNVRIPPYIQGDPVTAIGSMAFMNNQLISVTIPDTVTEIYSFAFAQNLLTSIIIPCKVTSISESAFAQNILTSVTIPDGIRTIFTSAFEGNQLTEITIPDSVRTIGSKAFYNNQLTSITISDRLSFIGGFAFAKNQLTGITIPNRVRYIYESAFEENRLTSVTIPDSVISIDKLAFASNRLTNINISAEVKINGTPFDDDKFVDFYLENGRRAGDYSVSNGRWSVILAEVTTIEPEIDGTYEIVTAYANLYNRYVMDEIETERLGAKITIDGNKALFGNEEYQLYDNKSEYYGKYGTYGMMDYEYFLSRLGGMNYNGFDENIIGKNYSGRVKTMTMKNDRNEYRLFSADNKLIVEISVYFTREETETEFKDLIISWHDHFFYIAEKVIE